MSVQDKGMFSFYQVLVMKQLVFSYLEKACHTYLCMYFSLFTTAQRAKKGKKK